MRVTDKGGCRPIGADLVPIGRLARDEIAVQSHGGNLSIPFWFFAAFLQLMNEMLEGIADIFE